MANDSSQISTNQTYQSKALERLAQRRVGSRIAKVVFGMLVLTTLVLIFVPWQQTIVGSGEVTVFDPNSRPQTIEAQIPGRITKWLVQEGQTVEQGQLLAEIEDIDSKFLDPKIIERFDNQAKQLSNSQGAELSRSERISQQINEIRGSRDQQLKNARQRVQQAKNRVNAATASLNQAKKNLEAFIRVAKASAEQRKLQAQDIVRQNEQALLAARQQLEIERINFDRVKYLFKEGLESKRNYELAENSKVSAETRVAGLQDAINAAKRVVELGTLGESQAEIDIARQRDVVNQALETLLASDRDVSIAENDISRIDNETNGLIASLEAQQQSAQSTVAKASSDIEKINVELANVTARRNQTRIVSPVSGKVVRVTKFGTGSTVKAGDILLTISPETTDRAVEIMVSDNDVSFVQLGRPVRLQFAGYPAVQFSGFPGISVGTFGGVVAFIDPMDDGSSRFRVIIKEENQTLPTGKKDKGWPRSANLRPGAEAVGWIMLDTVPLGYELWRQFNGFPPRATNNKDPRLGKLEKKSSTDNEVKPDKANKLDYLSPSI
ncbi:MAG: biotin/lipoyl-binding protein, partial [Fimbriimonadales bacterium]|nr:biotin/lipoyl-binding protein [Fimbriimonadales bacterium]